MTRTAADAQAEIEALEERARSACRTAVRRRSGVDDALRLVAETDDRVEPLRREQEHLARLELDAATPPPLRAQALRLRATYRSAEEWAMGAEDTWDALPTGEAKAWAAVAREAGRG